MAQHPLQVVLPGLLGQGAELARHGRLWLHTDPRDRDLTSCISMRLAARLIVTKARPSPQLLRKPSRDETLVKALVRAHQWRRRIESGQAKSITDLAEQEGLTDAYVCRLLPLTCLAPDKGAEAY